MTLRTAAIMFGIVFLVIGFLGFVPGAVTDDMLFGVFHVNLAHSLVHLISGSVALIVALGSVQGCRNFFRIFGLIYGVVAILGFVQPDSNILGVIANNMADTWLHVGIAATSLILGFAVPQRVAQRV